MASQRLSFSDDSEDVDENGGFDDPVGDANPALPLLVGATMVLYGGGGWSSGGSYASLLYPLLHPASGTSYWGGLKLGIGGGGAEALGDVVA